MGKSTESQQFQLNKKDWEQWLHNMFVFLAPLAVVYLTPIVGLLQTPFHVFSVNDFIPTNFTVGAMVLYIVNAIFDLSRKYVGGK